MFHENDYNETLIIANYILDIVGNQEVHLLLRDPEIVSIILDIEVKRFFV